MLGTKIKPQEEILKFCGKNFLIIVCYGCREVMLPVLELEELKESLVKDNCNFEEIITDYLCNHDYTKIRVDSWQDKIKKFEKIVVFSCGVGVQVLSIYIKRHIIAGCDTFYIKGFKGVLPSVFDCKQCGECFLNWTGGICPLTACTKGLLNGPCGGAKNGKCEISPEKECGWEKIYRRLEKNNKIDILKIYQKPRNYSLLVK